jgi:hypothetical protein
LGQGVPRRVQDGNPGYAFAVPELGNESLQALARALLAKKKERFYVSFQAFRQDLGAVRQLLSQRTLLRSHLKQGEKIRQHRHPDDEGKDQPKTHPNKFAGPFARTRRFENR